MAEEQSYEVGLDTIMGGAVIERFKYEVGRLVENIADPNTTLQKRSVQITLEAKPNKSRTQNDVVVKFNTKLAPTEPMETVIFISRTRNGLVASEYNPKEPFLPGTVAEPVSQAAASNVTPLRVAGGEQ